MDTLGLRIKQIRKTHSLTQQQFAEKISVSRSFISKVESGKENLSDSLIKLISATFDINYNWIKFGLGDMEHKERCNTIQKARLILDNSNLIDQLINASNYRTKQNLSFVISLIVNLFQNTKVQENSQLYYQDKIINIILRLTSFCNLINNENYDIDLQRDTLSQINSLMDDIELSFTEENLDESLEQ